MTNKIKYTGEENAPCWTERSVAVEETEGGLNKAGQRKIAWKNNWQNYSNHTIRNGIALVIKKGNVNEKHRYNLFNELLWNEIDDSSSIKNLIG